MSKTTNKKVILKYSEILHILGNQDNYIKSLEEKVKIQEEEITNLNNTVEELLEDTYRPF